MCFNEQSRMQSNEPSNESTFYPFSIKTSKCSGSWNNVNDPYAKLCAPDVVKNIKYSIQCQELIKQDA